MSARPSKSADILPPLAGFVALVAAWWGAVAAFGIPPFILPDPAAVLRAGVENARALAVAFALSASAALIGLALSIAAGLAAACVFSISSLVRRGFYPYAIFLQTVPIVAIAPVIINAFGSGLPSIVAIVVVISVFPVITSGTTGLLAVDREHLELFRVHNASPMAVFWKLRLPGAIPYVVSGARVSSGLAVIGAIVGEYMAGYSADHHGLGHLVLVTSSQLKIDTLFATIFASTVLGIAIFTAVGAIGDRITARWREGE